MRAALQPDASERQSQKSYLREACSLLRGGADPSLHDEGNYRYNIRLDSINRDTASPAEPKILPTAVSKTSVDPQACHKTSRPLVKRRMHQELSNLVDHQSEELSTLSALSELPQTRRALLGPRVTEGTPDQASPAFLTPSEVFRKESLPSGNLPQESDSKTGMVAFREELMCRLRRKLKINLPKRKKFDISCLHAAHQSPSDLVLFCRRALSLLWRSASCFPKDLIHTGPVPRLSGKTQASGLPVMRSASRSVANSANCCAAKSLR